MLDRKNRLGAFGIMIFISVLIMVPFPIPAFADGHEIGCIIKEPIEKVFDTIDDFAQAQTNSSEWFDQDKKDEINKVTKSGTNAGKTAFELWCDFHHFIVDAVFAGSPVPFDKGIIVLVSFVLGTILIAKLFLSFFKKIWKIVIAILGVIAVIMISGMQFPSIT